MDSNIYCVYEKKKTPTTDIQQYTAKNGRAMLKGICSSCGRKKSTIIKK